MEPATIAASCALVTPFNGVAAVIRGVVSNGFPSGILDPECPAAQMVAGIGGFLELDAPIVGVGEGYAGSLVRLNRYGFHGGIEGPVGIVGWDFPGVQRPRLQAADGHSAVRPGCEGRTGHRIGAGRVIIQPDFPAGEICAGVGLLDQADIAQRGSLDFEVGVQAAAPRIV